MADQQQLDLLKKNVQAWIQWRKENLNTIPNLSGANLGGAYLGGADLREADLTGADLREADLREADLSRADLTSTDLSGAYLVTANFSGADLRKADLSGAYLSGAYLTEADLTEADLTEANLSGANLGRANLSGANLSNANFIGTAIGWTIFGNVDLSIAKELETIRHDGPSTIGIDTIYLSQGNIPEVFLKGVGIDDTFITYIHSLVGKAIEYSSCFISYSSKDEALAKRLYADLQSHNVRCWFAPEDLKWGERTRTGIDQAIRIHDKLLLILSKHSLASGWVEHEVKTALDKERKEKRTVLFPLRVDNAILDCPFAWATEIRHERNIGNFCSWKKSHDAYQEVFTRLLRDLKAEA